MCVIYNKTVLTFGTGPMMTVNHLKSTQKVYQDKAMLFYSEECMIKSKLD